MIALYVQQVEMCLAARDKYALKQKFRLPTGGTKDLTADQFAQLVHTLRQQWPGVQATARSAAPPPASAENPDAPRMPVIRLQPRRREMLPEETRTWKEYDEKVDSVSSPP